MEGVFCKLENPGNPEEIFLGVERWRGRQPLQMTLRLFFLPLTPAPQHRGKSRPAESYLSAQGLPSFFEQSDSDRFPR